jgi:hypothetical protein
MKFKDTNSGKIVEADEKWAKIYSTRTDLILIEEAVSDETDADEVEQTEEVEASETPTNKRKKKQ